MKYPLFLSPFEHNRLRLKNRAIMGSMHTGLEEEKEFTRLAAFYEERARGDVAMIITGGISPNPEGAVLHGAATMDSDELIEKHKVITDAVAPYDCKMIMQILHAGRYAMTPLAVAPSAIQAPISPVAPRAMTAEDIEKTIEDFGESARRAEAAGYHGVEIMGSEGYLINQFLVEHTNKRDDEWGGSYENRMRLPVEIVRRIRQKTSDEFLIVFRLSLLDLVPNGSTWDEIVMLAKALEKEGVDLFNTGIGWHEARIPTIATSVPRAAFREYPAKLKREVSVPVTAVNRINSPEVAEDILAKGEADLITMARPFLADSQFVAKAKAAAADAIVPCIACNQACLDHTFAFKTSSCLVNPRACHETKMHMRPADNSKKVAVIGGGPAGMNAALVAAERGHDVTLFEKNELGGQLRYAAKIPGKDEFQGLLDFYRQRVVNSAICVEMKEVDAAALRGFDDVIVATGVVPRKLGIEGEDLPHVLPYDKAFSTKKIGEKVIVIGAGGVGYDLSAYLVSHDDDETIDAWKAEWGIVGADKVSGGLVKPEALKPARKVTMLQRKNKPFGRSLGKTTGWIHRLELKKHGVEMINNLSYKRIDEAGLWIERDGEEMHLPADNIIVCAGQTSLDELANEDLGKANVHVIGGAKLASEIDAKRAIAEAFDVAMSI